MTDWRSNMPMSMGLFRVDIVYHPTVGEDIWSVCGALAAIANITGKHAEANFNSVQLYANRGDTCWGPYWQYKAATEKKDTGGESE